MTVDCSFSSIHLVKMKFCHLVFISDIDLKQSLVLQYGFMEPLLYSQAFVVVHMAKTNIS